MVQVTSVLLGIILLVIMLVVALVILSGSVPAFREALGSLSNALFPK